MYYDENRAYELEKTIEQLENEISNLKERVYCLQRENNGLKDYVQDLLDQI